MKANVLVSSISHNTHTHTHIIPGGTGEKNKVGMGTVCSFLKQHLFAYLEADILSK